MAKTKQVEPKEQTFLDQRKSRHGDFKIQADIAQALKELIRGRRPNTRQESTLEVLATKWESLEPHQREGLDMILHKVARIMAGDANYDDHWRDIGGYSTRVQETLKQTIP